MSQKRQYKQYPQEFKEEAVALVSDQGYSVPEAANSLGIRSNLLYRWKDKIDEKAAGTALAEDERIELQRLRVNGNLKLTPLGRFSAIEF